MKKDATQRAITEIANSWSAHSTINHVRSPDISPLVRAAAGVRGNAQESRSPCQACGLRRRTVRRQG